MGTIHAGAVKELGGAFEPYEYTVDGLDASEVEIDVMHCGICHSDQSIPNNDWGVATYPLVAGHEVVGKIASVGSDVSGFAEGDLVGLGWAQRETAFCGSDSRTIRYQCVPSTGWSVIHICISCW